MGWPRNRENQVAEVNKDEEMASEEIGTPDSLMQLHVLEGRGEKRKKTIETFQIIESKINKHKQTNTTTNIVKKQQQNIYTHTKSSQEYIDYS